MRTPSRLPSYNWSVPAGSEQPFAEDRRPAFVLTDYKQDLIVAALLVIILMAAALLM